MKTNFKFENLNKMRLAYVSHKGDFSKIGEAYSLLMAWAGKNGLLENPELKRITIYHDDPNEVGEKNVRQSACVIINKTTSSDAGVGTRETSSGKYAIGSFEIGFEDFGKAWESVFNWIKEEGKEHTEGDCFEIFHNNFMNHPEKKSIVDICIPVK